MKKDLLISMKFCSLLVLALLAIIIFTPACKEEIEYRPSARFILKGTVLSESDNLPLEGIIVIFYHETKSFDSLNIDSQDILLDTDVTDQNGIFQVTDSLGVPIESVYNLAFIDTTNSSKAPNKEHVTLFTYVFRDLKFTNGDGHWYAGECIKEEVEPFLLKTN